MRVETSWTNDAYTVDVRVAATHPVEVLDDLRLLLPVEAGEAGLPLPGGAQPGAAAVA